jgi:hypothetical protein
LAHLDSWGAIQPREQANSPREEWRRMVMESVRATEAKRIKGLLLDWSIVRRFRHPDRSRAVRAHPPRSGCVCREIHRPRWLCQG